MPQFLAEVKAVAAGGRISFLYIGFADFVLVGGGTQVTDESWSEALVSDDFLMKSGEEELPRTPSVVVDDARQQDDRQDHGTGPAYDRKGKQKVLFWGHDDLLACFLQ